MQILLISITLLNLIIGFRLYLVLRRSRLLFGDRFAYTAAFYSSSIMGIVTSLNLVLLFPNHLEIAGVLNILIGISIGYLFGSLVNAQSLLAGIYNGGVGAIMGTMAGAVVNRPSLCGLPGTLASEQEMILFFAILSLVIQGISTIMILFSFKA